jgi:hypothetical protein
MYEIDIGNIDFPLLLAQKHELIRYVAGEIERPDKTYIEGLINFLDHIGDELADTYPDEFKYR